MHGKLYATCAVLKNKYKRIKQQNFKMLILLFFVCVLRIYKYSLFINPQRYINPKLKPNHSNEYKGQICPKTLNGIEE